MPASANKEYNTFVKGLVTEAGPLTFPENASLDEENFVLNRNGSRQRRLGMDFEESYVLRNATVEADDAVAVYRWFNAANDAANQFAVVQTGQILTIYNLDSTSVSGSLITTLDLSASITGKKTLDTSSGMGYLFVCDGTSDPIFLQYNPSTNAVTAQSIDLKIRDFFGLDDGLDVDEKPATLSTEHQYNLLNQGWTSTLWTAYEVSDGNYPSNAQQWWLGKDADDNFDPTLLNKQDFGTTPAPRGRMIIDAFTRSTSRDALTGLTTPSDIETGRPSCVAFASERVFYSGVDSSFSVVAGTSPNYNGYVFFSRTLRNTKDFGQCYSDADPSSEVDAELVDTDGGYINIPASGRIWKLLPKGSSVLVFAEQGIWQISGGEGGFIATAYVVEKITDIGVLSGTTIVDTEETVVYWNRGGIYVLQGDAQSGRLASTNISESSVQTLFNDITLDSKRTAVGSYDPVNRRLSWLYNDEEDYSFTEYRNRYNKELVLDVVLGAFSKNSISTAAAPSPYLAGYVETPDFLLRQEGVRTRFDSVTKYLTVQFIDTSTNSAVITFSYYRNADFLDWAQTSGGGVSYSSYLITGYEIMGDTMRSKSAPYMFCHFKQTEQEFVEGEDGLEFDNPSGCFVQAHWDWTNDSSSGKWSNTFQAYRLKRPFIPALGPFVYGQEVVTTRNLVRGSGRALSIKFESEEGKDLYLYGWALKFTGESSV